MYAKLVRGSLLLMGCAIVLNAATAQQPTTTPDKIVVRDKDKKDGSTKTYDGILKPAPAGYQIISADGKVLATVSPVDIVKVTPGDPTGVDRLALLAMINTEEKKTRKDYETAKLGYIDLIAKAASAPPKTKQYLAFKKALVSTHILDELDDDEWSKQVEPVSKEWSEFLSEYKTGWELWPAARTCARLYAETNKYAEVEKIWKQLTAKEVELPADLKQAAALLMIDAQIRQGGNVLSTASLKADELAKTAVGVVAKDKLAIYSKVAAAGNNPSPETLAATVKEIEDKIAASKEPAVREAGYSMMGELYLAAKRPRDAMWSFLWVETVYNQDKDEVLKALVRLDQIFKNQMDDDHEKMTKEKLRQLRPQL